MSKAKKIFFVLLILVSLGIASYPFISNYLYEHQADNKITVYQDKIKNTTKEEQEEMLRQAREYNAGLFQSQVRLTDPFAEEAQEESMSYDALLNPNGDGIHGICGNPLYCRQSPNLSWDSSKNTRNRHRASGRVFLACWGRQHTYGFDRTQWVK